MTKPEFFDVHSHINFPQYKNDQEAVLDRMRKNNIWTITVGVDKKTSESAVEFAEKRIGIFATIGLHPTDNKKEEFNDSDYESLVKSKKVIAIGECGLDYFRISEDDTKEKDRQKLEFKKQIQFAINNNLPIMLHLRPKIKSMDAYIDAIEILSLYKKENGDKLRGNSHFFVGDLNIVKKFLNLGFTFSFTGVITFTNDYDEVIKFLPINSVLSETDSPYVSPKPYRGKRNEPKNVIEVVKRISELKELDLKTTKNILVENALRVFSINS